MMPSPLILLVFVVIGVGAWWVGPQRRWSFLREIGLISLAYGAYSTVRSVTEGDVSTALLNAERIVEFEERFGVFWEPDLQSMIVDLDWAVTLVNWMYVWGHWPLIGAAAIWMWRTNGDRYRLFRNSFMLSGAIGLFFFWLVPTAPPRLAGLDLLDTVSLHSDSYRIFQPPDFVNQYAAFPSLHFGWNMLIAIAVATHYRGNRPVMVLAAMMPLAMFSAIVFSANHFLLDAAGGGVVALAGLGIAMLLDRRRRRRDDYTQAGGGNGNGGGGGSGGSAPPRAKREYVAKESTYERHSGRIPT